MLALTLLETLRAVEQPSAPRAVWLLDRAPPASSPDGPLAALLPC